MWVKAFDITNCWLHPTSGNVFPFFFSWVICEAFALDGLWLFPTVCNHSEWNLLHGLNILLDILRIWSKIKFWFDNFNSVNLNQFMGQSLTSICLFQTDFWNKPYLKPYLVNESPSQHVIFIQEIMNRKHVEACTCEIPWTVWLSDKRDHHCIFYISVLWHESVSSKHSSQKKEPINIEILWSTADPFWGIFSPLAAEIVRKRAPSSIEIHFVQTTHEGQ